MSAQGLQVIDHTVQLTHEWINELVDRLEWSSPKDALRLMRVTLTTIRDHLGHEEVAQFAAQLPLLIRGMFYEGWRPSDTPVRERDRASFVLKIEALVGDVTEYRGPEDISSVFKVINARISQGEVDDVRAGLPEAIRGLWPT